MPRPQSIFEGDVYQNDVYGEYKVIEYNSSKDILIEFTETGYKYYTHANVIRMNLVRDPYAKTVFGLGYYGEPCVDYRVNRQPHDTWWNMMSRCYYEKCPEYYRYGGKGVKVADEWHSFPNFCKWFLENYKEGYQLDKDILSRKVYSPETCLMIPQRLNSCISYKKIKNNADGVFENDYGWVATYHIGDGKTKRKSFTCKSSALKWYQENKVRWVTAMVESCYEDGEIDDYIRGKCYNYINRLEEEYAS